MFVLRFDAQDGRLSLESESTMRPRAGPRHIAFHPSGRLAFVLNELESIVATCRWDADAGRLVPFDRTTTLPQHFFGAGTAAAIVVSPSGRQVLVSNRGHDTLARLTFDNHTTRLVPVGRTPSQGCDPRFITLDPSARILLVANEQGDNVVAFDCDTETSALVKLDRTVTMPSPTTIAFI